MIYKNDGYEFHAPSKQKGKKYDVYKDGVFLLSFGGLGYGHYHDRIGHYSADNHDDRQRQRAYLSRHHPGLTRKEALETTPRDSPKYFSTKYLW